MPEAKALAKLRADAEQMKAEADRMVSEAVQADELEKAATKIQAAFRGKRDRAIVEVKKVKADFKKQNKAEREMMFAMNTQNSLAGLTDVKAMTAAIRNATEQRGWVIDPVNAEWTAYWDLMMMLLLTSCCS